MVLIAALYKVRYSIYYLSSSRANVGNFSTPLRFARRITLNSSQSGFSLVELIVVLSILTILFGLFFLMLDPLEYINRASDARRQKTAIELYDSFVRYYAVKSYFPWNNEPPIIDCPPISLANQPLGTPGLTRATDRKSCIQSVIDASELKTSFLETNMTVLDDIFISDETPTLSSSSKIYICFLPESKHYKRNIQTTYSESGGKETSGCIAQGGSKVCAWCAR